MIVIELKGAINASGTLKTFYLSDTAYATKASDTPANTAFDPSVTDPGTITETVFGDGLVAGSTELTIGEILLNNLNGQFDAWLDYGFDGRPVIIRKGETGAAYPAGFSVLFSGTVVNLYVDRKEARIRVKGKKHLLEKPVLDRVYAGNNALPSGAEGTAADIKGKAKPRLWGIVNNISPPCVNTSKLTYQVNDGAVNDITAVYDRGVSLTKGSNYTTLALLEAATVTAGTYATCFALGLFRLGASPAGLVTADANEGAASANRTVAQIMKRVFEKLVPPNTILNNASAQHAAYGSVAVTKTNVATKDPFGNTGTVAKFTANSNINGRCEVAVPAVIGSYMNGSVFVRNIDSPKSQLIFYDNVSAIKARVYLDWSGADITAMTMGSPSPATYGYEYVTDGWWRIWTTGTANAATEYFLIYPDVTTGTKSIEVYGACGTMSFNVGDYKSSDGVYGTQVDAASVTALDTLNNATVGIYVDDPKTTYLDVLDELAQSIGAYYGFDGNGKFIIGQWAAPSGTSLVTIGEFYAGRQTERRPLKDVTSPAWKVTVNHSKLYTTQDNDLAGSVTDARRAVLKTGKIGAVSTDLSIPAQFLQAQALEFDTLLTVEAAALAEAARLLALHKVRRDAFDVPVPLSLVTGSALKLGACVTLQISRFGLSGGKLMRIQGMRQEQAKNRAILTVWG